MGGCKLGVMSIRTNDYFKCGDNNECFIVCKSFPIINEKEAHQGIVNKSKYEPNN